MAYDAGYAPSAPPPKSWTTRCGPCGADRTRRCASEGLRRWYRQDRAVDPRGHPAPGGERLEHQRGVCDRDARQMLATLLEIMDDRRQRDRVPLAVVGGDC